tara:strand:+ start:1036 stop:1425 length:390 start_codon:yes stop_codon:yes gene_type:complete
MKDAFEELTDRVNALYEGLSPMEIRRCVINMSETQFLDLSMREVMENRDVIVNIWNTDDEKLYADDIRWDHEHPEVKENAPAVEDYKVVSDTGDAYVAFNSSARDEEPVPEEYGDPSTSIEQLLNEEGV